MKIKIKGTGEQIKESLKSLIDNPKIYEVCLEEIEGQDALLDCEIPYY